MRVAIVNLTRGGLSGGYVKYLQRMIPRLASHPDIEQLDVFAPAAAQQRLLDQPWPIRTWAEGTVSRGFRPLKREVQECRPDVIFIPTASWLDFGPIPVVVMVRNMEPLSVPFGGNPPRAALTNLARRGMARRACRRAARVVAVSNHVRDFLTSHWHIPSQRVGVVYHGVDATNVGPQPVVPPRLADLRAPFVFAAGSIRPARGLVDLVDAMSHLKAAGSPIVAVVAGQVDAGMQNYQRKLLARATQAGTQHSIIWIGSLNEAEMRWCYDNCAAFVVTSRAEACPNIALEAMSHGCACVSVDGDPMPEFFGPAAAYYSTGDGAGLARTLGAVLGAEPGTAALRAAAALRAQAFDWHLTATGTIAELRSALT